MQCLWRSWKRLSLAKYSSPLLSVKAASGLRVGLDSMAIQAERSFVQIARRRIKEQSTPIGQPDAISKRQYTKMTHGKADTRGLTATELGVSKLTELANRVERNLLVQDQVRKRIIVSSANSCIISSSTASLPTIRTPERPRPRRSPSPEAAPPSSTAPPRLGDDTGIGKRKRSTTARYRRK